MGYAGGGLKIIRSRIILIAFFALCFLVLGQTARAEEKKENIDHFDPLEQKGNYSSILYDNTNGLPTSEANDIDQTSEGFIWIGSYSGLVRYDGSSFVRVDSASDMGSVTCLHVDSKDRLWVGTNENGIFMQEKDSFHAIDQKDGLCSSLIRSIEEDEKGNLYVGTTEGITLITPDLEIRPIDDSRISKEYITWLNRGNDGLIYGKTNEDDIFSLKDGKVDTYIDHTENVIKGIICVFPDPEEAGKIYIGTNESTIYHKNMTDKSGKGEEIDINPLSSVTSMRQIGDRIWICAINGVGVLDSNGLQVIPDIPMNNSVNNVMEDYEGNLWFTSSRQGVMKMVPNRFTDIFYKYNLPQSVVNSTCMYKKQLFIATDTGLEVVNEKGRVSSLPLKEARTASGVDLKTRDLLNYLDGCRIRSIIRDSHDQLWLSTWRAHGLLRYDGERLTAFTEAEGLPSDHIRTVSETGNGAILVVCTGGLSMLRDDRLSAIYTDEKDGITNPESLTVCCAPNGDILLGSDGGGIYVIGERGIRCINKENGLSSEVVMRIKYDSKRHIFWLVTGNSIAWMTEDYKVTTVKNFPYTNNFDLYENSKGFMWILSSDGIYVTPSEDLIKDKKIVPVHFGIANGMPCISTANSYSELTENGDLYMAGNLGVVKVNIEASPEDISILKQAVPYIDDDNRRYYPDSKGNFTLPSGVQKLTVYGYVFNYSLSDPQVTYYLKGFDKKSVTVSRSQLRPAIYTNLPGGSYRFVMKIKDSSGQAEKTLRVTINKEKALYEQVWFYILTGLLLLLLVGLLTRAYVRRRIRNLEKKHKEEKEKERVNNELKMANQIQSGMLPSEFPPFPDRKEFDLYAMMDPARQVGGDFYDFFMIDNDHLCLVIADVSDKGIPAALFMMNSKVILESISDVGRSPAEILTRANEDICANNKMKMFVTVWLGILEISTGRLEAANAGHEYPTIYRAGGAFELFKDKHCFVMGGMEGLKYKGYELQLHPGDKIFVYTDGVPEASNVQGDMFGTERMVEVLNENTGANPEELLKRMREAVDDFVQDAEQFDDLTMLCIEYKGPNEQ